jgi:hypothetical protein
VVRHLSRRIPKTSQPLPGVTRVMVVRGAEDGDASWVALRYVEESLVRKLRCADHAFYRAKDYRRDRVVPGEPGD